MSGQTPPRHRPRHVDLVFWRFVGTGLTIAALVSSLVQAVAP